MSVTRVSPERVASNALLREWCRGVTGHVLSVGSGGDIDKQGGRYRDYFVWAASYTTSDVDPSLGCDLVLDIRAMPTVPTEAYDAVFCSGVLEHVDDVQTGVREIWRVLKPLGVLLVGVPFKQPVHRAPQDFWRLTPFGLRYLLRDFLIDDLEPIGAEAFPTAYWAKARKPL